MVGRKALNATSTISPMDVLPAAETDGNEVSASLDNSLLVSYRVISQNLTCAVAE